MVSENQLNRRIGTTVGLIVIVSATLMACSPTSTGNGADGSTTDLDGTPDDGGGGGADSGDVVEQCNTIDDDDDGLVDENGPCLRGTRTPRAATSRT